MKTHLRKVLGDTKLTYEELATLLGQIESCLNSRPLVPLNNDEDGIEALTLGHFIIGRPLAAIPDAPSEMPIALFLRDGNCVRHY